MLTVGRIGSSGLVESLEQIAFIREEKLSNTNLLVSRFIKREKPPLPVRVRRSFKLWPSFPMVSYVAPE